MAQNVPFLSAQGYVKGQCNKEALTLLISVFGLETSDRWKYPLPLYVCDNVVLRKVYLGIHRESLKRQFQQGHLSETMGCGGSKRV